MVAAHHRTNRLQIIAYSIITIVLAVAAAFGISWFLLNPKPLKLAVGPAGGVYARFAEKLVAVVARESRLTRIVAINTDNDGDSLTRLHRGTVDLAIARTDSKVPADARAVALLERELMYVVTSKARRFSSLASLKGMKVAIPGKDPQNEIFIKRLLETVEIAAVSYAGQTVPQDASFEKLLIAPAPAPFQAVVALTPVSYFGGTAQRDQIGHRVSQFELHGIDGGGAIEKKVPGVFSETMDAGMVASSPAWPDDDVDTVGLHHLLLTRKQMSGPKAAELTRIIVENKEELGLDHEFATLIEPPDADKTAQILAHPGSADYVNDEVKTFLDRYGDLFYISTAAAGLIGSVFVAIYSWVTRVDPIRASSLAGDNVLVGERIKKATALGELDVAETEMEDILKRVLTGLQDETMSAEGLDAFRLSHDNARRALMTRRNALIGGAGHEPARATSEETG